MRVFSAIAVLTLLAAAGCGDSAPENKLEGIWEGKLVYPGIESRVALRISEAEGGVLEAVFLRPDDSDAEVEGTLLRSGDSLRVDLPTLRARFEGRLLPGGERIEGRWIRGAWTQDLQLDRVARLRKVARPQTPRFPYPYETRELAFEISGRGARMVGTLTLPREGGPFPALVLLPGAGAHDRDNTFQRHRPFLVIADYLTRRGLAVLRCDDRGVGSSTGSRQGATTEDFAADALAAIEMLRAQPGVDPERIGLLGHSEGGTKAALAAASPDVAFIVMLGSPGLPGREYNLQFEESMGRAMGLDDAAIAAKRAFQERVLDIILGEKVRARAEERLGALLRERDPGMPEARLRAGLQRFLSPWFLYNVRLEPAEILAGIDCPVLALFGGLDMQVPAEGNLEAMREALAAAGNPDFQVDELAGLNHFFQSAETGAPDEYGRIEETISPRVLERVADWILERGQRN